MMMKGGLVALRISIPILNEIRVTQTSLIMLVFLNTKDILWCGTLVCAVLVLMVAVHAASAHKTTCSCRLIAIYCTSAARTCDLM